MEIPKWTLDWSRSGAAARRQQKRYSDLKLDHDVTRNGVVVEGEDGEIFAVARTFESAVRHFVDQHEVGVDPGASVAEGGCDFHALG